VCRCRCVGVGVQVCRCLDDCLGREKTWQSGGCCVSYGRLMCLVSCELDGKVGLK
jgi:hypothetical protein